MTPDLRPHQLAAELRRRGELDQAVRARMTSGRRAAGREFAGVDDGNTAWLKAVVDAVGWPGRSFVGEEGAHTAWLLAQHADRDPAFQRRCLGLLRQAVDDGEAAPADLAYLTDRVLLAGGEPQLYGTQLTARDGRLMPCRLRDPDTVDDRRAAAGLEPLDSYLRHVLELNGPPAPARITCTRCDQPVDLWLPEPGETVTLRCPSCGSRARIRAGRPGVPVRGRILEI